MFIFTVTTRLAQGARSLLAAVSSLKHQESVLVSFAHLNNK